MHDIAFICFSSCESKRLLPTLFPAMYLLLFQVLTAIFTLNTSSIEDSISNGSNDEIIFGNYLFLLSR
jgi:CRISPR/Cas system CMR-associated protein Cmr3 (group 5 of RAMP superfamily)